MRAVNANFLLLTEKAAKPYRVKKKKSNFFHGSSLKDLEIGLLV